jgi:hypothetical protein
MHNHILTAQPNENLLFSVHYICIYRLIKLLHRIIVTFLKMENVNHNKQCLLLMPQFSPFHFIFQSSLCLLNLSEPPWATEMFSPTVLAW